MKHGTTMAVPAHPTVPSLRWNRESVIHKDPLTSLDKVVTKHVQPSCTSPSYSPFSTTESGGILQQVSAD